MPAVTPTVDIDDATTRALLDAMPEGLLVVDARGQVLYANPEVEHILGYPPGDLVGLTLAEIVRGATELGGARAQGAAAEPPHMAPRPVNGFGLSARCRDGTSILLDVGIAPLDAVQGPLVMAVVSDATEREARERAAWEADLRQLRDEDRERIARELHDTVIQRLFAAGMAVDVIRSECAETALHDRLERVVGEIDAAVHEIRTAIFGLAGRMSGRGLRESVLEVVREATPALRATPSLRFLGPVDAVVSAEVAEQLVPTLREALANVARHAAADHVEVVVEVRDTEVSLVVADDGVGPLAAAATPQDQFSGRGLRNISRRAEDLGGRASLTARAEGGAALEWCVPVRARP